MGLGEKLKRIFRKTDPQGAYAQIVTWIDAGDPLDYAALRREFKVREAAADAMGAEVRNNVSIFSSKKRPGATALTGLPCIGPEPGSA